MKTPPTTCPALPATTYALGAAAWFRSTPDQSCKRQLKVLHRCEVKA